MTIHCLEQGRIVLGEVIKVLDMPLKNYKLAKTFYCYRFMVPKIKARHARDSSNRLNVLM